MKLLLQAAMQCYTGFLCTLKMALEFENQNLRPSISPLKQCSAFLLVFLKSHDLPEHTWNVVVNNK